MIFESNAFIENKIFQTESEIFLVSTGKDRLFQLFCKHTNNSSIINKTKERLKSKQYFNANCDNILKSDVMLAITESVEEFSKWLVDFLIKVPGFDQFCPKDFNSLVYNSLLFLFGLHTTEYVIENEYYLIVGNDPKCFQMTRNRLNLAFGTFKTNLIFEIHSKLHQLKLSQNEKSILFPFCILKMNRNFSKFFHFDRLVSLLFKFSAEFIIEKEKYLSLKVFYTKMLIYEFKQNSRGKNFYDLLQEVC